MGDGTAAFGAVGRLPTLHGVEAAEDGAGGLTDGFGAAGLRVDVDMGEVALGGGCLGVIGEEGDVVADGAGAQVGDAQACGDGLGEGQFGEVVAAGGDDEEDVGGLRTLL